MISRQSLLIAGCAGIVFSSQALASAALSEGLESKNPGKRLRLATTLSLTQSKLEKTQKERRKTIDHLFKSLRSQFSAPEVPQIEREPIQLARSSSEEETSCQGDFSSPSSMQAMMAGAGRRSTSPQREGQDDEGRDRVHRVVSGDTLISISRRYYGSSSHWKMLQKLNGLENPSSIKIGQRLLIPKDPKEPGSARKKTVPLTSVASSKYLNRHTAPSEKPLDYNHYEWKVYHVKPGDSLLSLARQYCGDDDMVSELAKYNNLDQERGLEAGSNILVPIPKSPEISKRYLLSTQGIFK